jgi:hypothetical protein
MKLSNRKKQKRSDPDWRKYDLFSLTSSKGNISTRPNKEGQVLFSDCRIRKIFLTPLHTMIFSNIQESPHSRLHFSYSRSGQGGLS